MDAIISRFEGKSAVFVKKPVGGYPEGEPLLASIGKIGIVFTLIYKVAHDSEGVVFKTVERYKEGEEKPKRFFYNTIPWYIL